MVTTSAEHRYCIGSYCDHHRIGLGDGFLEQSVAETGLFIIQVTEHGSISSR